MCMDYKEVWCISLLSLAGRLKLRSVCRVIGVKCLSSKACAAKRSRELTGIWSKKQQLAINRRGRDSLPNLHIAPRLGAYNPGPDMVAYFLNLMVNSEQKMDFTEDYERIFLGKLSWTLWKSPP